MFFWHKIFYYYPELLVISNVKPIEKYLAFEACTDGTEMGEKINYL
jgi:hypothetical protein